MSYLLDQEYNAFCKNEAELLEYCKDGGWEDIQDLLEETGHPIEVFINNWFIVIHGRVYYR